MVSLNVPHSVEAIRKPIKAVKRMSWTLAYVIQNHELNFEDSLWIDYQDDRRSADQETKKHRKEIHTHPTFSKSIKQDTPKTCSGIFGPSPVKEALYVLLDTFTAQKLENVFIRLIMSSWWTSFFLADNGLSQFNLTISLFCGLFTAYILLSHFVRFFTVFGFLWKVESIVLYLIAVLRTTAMFRSTFNFRSCKQSLKTQPKR